MSTIVLGRPGYVNALTAKGIVGVLPIAAPRPNPIQITTYSPESVGPLAWRMGAANATNLQWPAANLAIYVPFGINYPMLVLKLWVMKGATTGAGNIDVAIYNAGPAGPTTRIVAIGSTAVSAGASQPQALDITDTVLNPGRYYLGMCSDTAGATQLWSGVSAATANFISVLGNLEEAVGAVTLPSPATPVVNTRLMMPWVGLTTRSLV